MISAGLDRSRRSRKSSDSIAPSIFLLGQRCCFVSQTRATIQLKHAYPVRFRIRPPESEIR
jgi:hypothetical protein